MLAQLPTLTWQLVNEFAFNICVWIQIPVSSVKIDIFLSNHVAQLVGTKIVTFGLLPFELQLQHGTSKD